MLARRADLERQPCSQPELAGTMIWTEETPGLQTTGNCAERRCRRASVAHAPDSRITRTIVAGRVREVRRVREVGGIRSELQGEPLGQLELTSQAQVHPEIARTTELVAVGVSQVSVGVAGNKGRREGARVEVPATQVAQGANAVAVGLTIQNMEWRHKVACLGGPDSVQRAGARDAERQPREVVDQRTDLPAAEDSVADARLCPPFSLAER